MRVLATVGLVVIAAVALLSCRSDEQTVRAWYEDRYAAVEDLLPPAEECDQHFADFNTLEKIMENESDRFQEHLDAVVAMKQAGYMNEAQMDREIQIYTDQYSVLVETMYDQFWSSRRLDGVQRDYCVGRLLARYHHDRGHESCRRFAVMARNEELAYPSDLGAAEYCLMYAPESFEGN